MNYLLSLFIVLFLIFIFLYIPISLFLSIRNDKRILKEAEADNKKWIEEELKLPPYKVLVFTKGSEKCYKSPSFKTTAGKPGRYWTSDEIDFNRSTSLEKAESFMENVIRRGAYYDTEKNLMIPVCEIESMRASND